MKTPIYGFPCVTDPNDFSPDVECSTPEEIEAHRLACETYNTPDYKPNIGCEWVTPNIHVARTSWGLGVNMVDVDKMNSEEEE